jgi:HAD superfamily hydrolase (TIGR01549 family)
MILDGTFLNISGVATAMAKERGVDIEQQEVRTRFLEELDKTMNLSGPGDELLTVLNTLRSASTSLGIVSFMRGPRLAKRLRTWKIDDYFRAVVTPEGFSEFKPSPAPFLAAIQQLELEPAECFVAGDEPVDMEGGKKAGARTVGVPRGFFTEEELKNAGAETIIPSLSDLPRIVVGQ